MKVFFTFFTILFAATISAQDYDCSAKIKEYQVFFKTREIEKSYNPWKEVKENCPKFNEVIYTDGINILQYKIDNAPNNEEKEKLVRETLALVDQYHNNFHDSTADFEIKKAMMLHDNKIGSEEEIFKLLDSGFTNAPKSITNANAIYIYFKSCFDKYTQNDKTFNADALLEKYMLLNSILTQLQITNPDKSTEYQTAARAIKSLSKEITTCDNLITFYEKNYPANQENGNWLETALSSLAEKCSRTNTFYSFAQKLYSLKATPKSASFSAIASIAQRKFAEAITYYTEAETLETNPLEKAKINYLLATGLLSNDKSKSKELLIKATTQDPKTGKVYLYLSQLYANAAEECGNSDFEKKAIYYLAIETAKKASVAEPYLKPATEKIESDYAKKTFSSSEITKAKMNGKSVKIGCWINESVKFPPKK
jgi:hypothetical protein